MYPFVHLHVHSQYSILDGQASIPRLVDKAIKDGMRGMALTDHGSMMGIKDFFNYTNKVCGKARKEVKGAQTRLAALHEGAAPDEGKSKEECIAECEAIIAKNKTT